MLSQAILLMAQPAGSDGTAANPIAQFLPLVLIAFIFYFMIYRPQKKRQKQREELVNKMEKGDKVITSSGIHGTISALEGDTVLVQVAEATKIRFEKSAITTVNPKTATS